MPLLKYFLVTGTLLSLLLCAWSEYLTPSETEIQRAAAPAKTVEVFRPTPAPPITEAERPAFGEAPGSPVRLVREQGLAKMHQPNHADRGPRPPIDMLLTETALPMPTRRGLNHFLAGGKIKPWQPGLAWGFWRVGLDASDSSVSCSSSRRQHSSALEHLS